MIKKIFGRAADGKYRALRKRALQNVPDVMFLYGHANYAEG